MLVLAAPTGAVENHEVRELLANIRRSQFTAIKERLDQGLIDGDLTAPGDAVATIARYYAAVVQALSVQSRDWATPDDLERSSPAPWLRGGHRRARSGHRARAGIAGTESHPRQDTPIQARPSCAPL